MHLHIIISSPVFTDPLVRRIQDYFGDYMILVTESFHKMTCITSQGQSTLDIFKAVNLIKSKSIQSCTAHFLSTQAAYIIRTLHQSVVVKWVVWGGDFYGLPEVRKQYLRGLTIKDSLKTNLGYRLIRLGLKRVNLIVANPCDQNAITSTLQLKVDYLTLNHQWTIEKVVKLKKLSNQEAILLGNSDDKYNNHPEVLEQLTSLVDNDTKIVLPLSGIDNAYTQQVKAQALASFTKAQILDRFVEIDEYQSILSSCSVLVYGHLRQQGMATLFSFLASGRKCYFWKDNVYFQYLKTLGFHVFALEDVKPSQFWDRLTTQQASENQQKLNTMLDTSLIHQQWKSIFEYQGP